ncbi:MAG: heterodisulfide reductase-related iron-sulfur binding cluster [Gammaproteobacteria bacterium]
MVRYRALEHAKGNVGLVERQLARIDRNGRLLGAVAPIANWASSRDNRICRTMVEKVAGIHRDAAVPRFESDPLSRRNTSDSPSVAPNAPAAGRKVVIYNNCFVEYNEPQIGLAARAVLAKNGIEATFVYPGCCGMPAMERGDLESVRKLARTAAGELCAWIDKGYDIVTLIPSCSFMVKNTWPLYFPDEPDIMRLSEATFDVCEYLVAVERTDGLAEGLAPLDGGVALHVACHARAQNIGPKAAVMLRLIPDIDVLVMERCSGHGGTWGMMKENFETGMEVGTDLITQTAESGRRYLSSECPLAGEQIVQGLERFPDGSLPASRSWHPIELLAMSYGVTPAP